MFNHRRQRSIVQIHLITLIVLFATTKIQVLGVSAFAPAMNANNSIHHRLVHSTALAESKIEDTFHNFSNVASLVINNDAAQVGDVLRLTPLQKNQAGTVFYATQLPVNENTSFSTRFQFRMDNNTDDEQGEGMTFMLQGNASSIVGKDGDKLGYGDIEKSVAIELDTRKNGDDLNDNHIALIVNGKQKEHLAQFTPQFDFDDGESHTLWIDYDGVLDSIQVYLAEGASTPKPPSPSLTHSVNLFAYTGATAYMGFSGGTSGKQNSHDVESWTFLVTDSPSGLNDEPTINNPGSQSTVTGQKVSLQIGASDLDNDRLTYSATGLPDGLTIDPQQGIITGQPHTVEMTRAKITVADGSGGTTTTSFTWGIYPYAVSVFEKTIDSSFDDVEEEADGTVLLTGSKLDLVHAATQQIIGLRFDTIDIPKDVTIAYAYLEFVTDKTSTISTSLSIHGQAGSDVLPFTSISANVSSRPTTNAIVQWPNIPRWDNAEEAHNSPDLSHIIGEIVQRDGWASGNAIAFIVSGTGTRVAKSYDRSPDSAPKLYVAYYPNQYPNMTKPNDRISMLGDATTLQIDAVDPDDDQLTYSAINLPDGLEINEKTGQIMGTPTSAGIYSVEAHVDDGKGGTDSHNFEWRINRPPTIISPGDRTVRLGKTVDLQIVASDPDNDSITIHAQNLPDGLSISPQTGRITGHVTTPTIYHVELSVDDGFGGRSQTAFVWCINRVPTVETPDNQISQINEAVEYQIVAEDPDGNTIFYNGTNLPTGLTMSRSGRIHGVPTSAGNFDVELSISDSHGETVQRNFSWLINRPPVVTEVDTYIGTVGDFIHLQLQATDPDDNPLRWNARWLPPSLVIDENQGIISGVPSSAGHNTVTLEISDGFTIVIVQFRFVIEERDNQLPPTMTPTPPTMTPTPATKTPTPATSVPTKTPTLTVTFPPPTVTPTTIAPLETSASTPTPEQTPPMITPIESVVPVTTPISTAQDMLKINQRILIFRDQDLDQNPSRDDIILVELSITNRTEDTITDLIVDQLHDPYLIIIDDSISITGMDRMTIEKPEPNDFPIQVQTLEPKDTIIVSALFLVSPNMPLSANTQLIQGQVTLLAYGYTQTSEVSLTIWYDGLEETNFEDSIFLPVIAFRRE